ncbi:hypothetical protein HID58_074802, partial [Brassica napus]
YFLLGLILQPDFYHHFLKDHKIQMKHNYHPERLFDNNKLWHQYGKCAKGTIPMRRTKEHDVLRESSFKRYGKTKHRTFLFLKSEEPDLMNQSSHQMRE